ncbi:MAG: V-type ATP synthase subunit I [Spirochaetales bacterium]|jgi:V/A-type H+-transporting ATPase subunit I|nr:V-type ATP synthase subunit I [Spirochaetales bacterium]
MIFPVKMEKTQLIIFKTDADAVLEYLGKKKCFQVSTDAAAAPQEEAPGRAAQMDEFHRKLLAVRAFLADGNTENAGGRTAGRRDQSVTRTAAPAEAGNVLRLPREEDIAAAKSMCEETGPLVAREKNLTERGQKAKNILDEIAAFRQLELPLRDMESVTFLAFRIGVIPAANLIPLKTALEGRAFITDLDGNGGIFAVSSKKGRFALDTELKKANFRETQISDEARNLPPNALAALENDLAAVEEGLKNLREEKARLAVRYEEPLGALLDIFAAGSVVEDLKTHLQSTQTAYILSGWIPGAESKKIIADLTDLTRGRIAIRMYAPEEIEAVRDGKEKIPVKLQHGKLLQAFSGIVISYGSPLYGTVDPTLVVSVFFVLLFAIMFGDVGQGFTGLVFGFILGTGKIPSLRKWEKFAPIFKVVGCACMVTGFLYGSVFCSEELLVRPTRFITAQLFGQEMDRFVTLLPNHGIDKILAFFGFTIGIGVLINSIGLVINIYNRLKLKDFRRAIFAKTGIVGAFLFWYTLAMAVRLGLGGVFSPADMLFICSALALLFWGEPLYRLLFRERPLFPEGVFSFVMEGFVEVMETVSYFISNSVSFLRVGAFALSHAVLSLIIFTLADLIEAVPGGVIFRILIITGGNILIIVLEGLIVSIQVIRLQYYEFFSKFFTESGEAFKPFELRTPGH